VVSEYKPGEKVNITIKDAVMSGRHDMSERIWFEVDGKVYFLPSGSKAVTVERVTPDVRAGDLWRNNGGLWFVTDQRDPDVEDDPYIRLVGDGGAEYDVADVTELWGPLSLVHREEASES